MPSPSLRDARLIGLYQRAAGAIAFVDESYRARPFPGERAFYSMSAVTYAKEHLDQVREVLTDIAGGRYWHTTEANELGRHEDIARMVRYVARQAEWNIVTVETPIPDTDAGVVRARVTCLAAITREVTRGSGPGAVRLIVADRNRDDALNRADQRTVARLRSVGEAHPDVALYHGRMGQEPMLWSADVVSWSAYRNFAVDDHRWVESLRPVLTVLDARTGKALNMKQPQAAAATPGAQQTTGAERGQSVVASASSVQRRRVDRAPIAPRFRRGTTVLDGLARQIAQGRSESGTDGYRAGNTPEALAERVRRLREQRHLDDRRDPTPDAEQHRGPHL